MTNFSHQSITKRSKRLNLFSSLWESIPKDQRRRHSLFKVFLMPQEIIIKLLAKKPRPNFQGPNAALA